MKNIFQPLTKNPKKVHERIKSNKWCQHHVTNRNGCQSTRSWIIIVYGDKDAVCKYKELLTVINKYEINKFTSITEWSDVKGRTFQQVLARLTEADI